MNATIRSVAALAALCLGTCSVPAFAQDNGWTGGVGGNWTDAASWQFFTVPDPSFDATATIGKDGGSSSFIGEVNISSDIRASNPAPSVILGDGAGQMGTLNINASGALHVITGGDAESVGNFDTGLNGGIGVLNVTGILEVDGRLSAATGADATSTITLSGSATVTAGDAFLDRNFIVDGSSVSASFTTDLILGLSGTHTWRIPVSGASTLLAGGNADLGGTLKVEFSGGAPSVGATWNLIDSVTVDDSETPGSGFSNIDSSSVIGLAPGATFAVNAVADGGSVNGVYTQLSLEQHPVLVVDRSTGTTTIRNFNATDSTVAFDAYVIGSPSLGALNQANWSSIAPTNGWVEANPNANALSELNPAASQSIAASDSIALGTPVTLSAPSSFGEENEDITFRFAKPGDSTFTEGQVVYTGVPNNTLTLNVDPSTGEAQILNGTNFTVSIDAYVISSGNESLRFGPGTWNSLDDQGTSGGDWFEANSSIGQLSELLVSAGMELAPDAKVNLGSPFNTAVGAEDLQFQFALVGGDSSGDYNGNGTVDAADYAVWLDNLGAADESALNDNGDGGGVTQSDYDVWKANFGATSVVGPPALLTGKVLYGPLVSGIGIGEAVPEPGSVGLALICLLVPGLFARPRFTK